MAICANGYRDNLGVFRTFGATVSNNAYPSSHHWQFARTGAMRNFAAGEGIQNPLAGIPSGHRHPSAWVMPQKAGALAARNTITGSGSVAADVLAVKLAEAALSGSGDLAAIGGLIVQAVAALTGSGTVTGADVQAFLAAVANLTGIGGVTDADLEGLGELVAAIAGSGTTAGSTMTGVGELSADLVVTGTGLTTANVGAAVWATLIEAGYTAEQVLRVLAAHAAGDATGLENGSPVFKGIDGTTDRIVGTYSGGTRTVTDLNGD